MAADYDAYLEQQRAERYDGDEDERGNEEGDEQGERADQVAQLWRDGYESRAIAEMDAEDDERCLKGWRDV